MISDERCPTLSSKICENTVSPITVPPPHKRHHKSLSRTVLFWISRLCFIDIFGLGKAGIWYQTKDVLLLPLKFAKISPIPVPTPHKRHHSTTTPSLPSPGFITFEKFQLIFALGAPYGQNRSQHSMRSPCTKQLHERMNLLLLIGRKSTVLFNQKQTSRVA